MGWIFSGILILAMAAMGARSLGKRLRGRAAKRGVGRRAEAPMSLRSFHELDPAVEAARCACGGSLIRLGEGSRSTPLGELRVVRCECAACEEEVDLFFHIAELRH